MNMSITAGSRGIENLVYLFSCFLSCVIIAGLMFQFMGDRYEKAFVNPWAYRIAAAAAVVIVTLVNLKHNTWWNMGANFLVYGIASFICYEDKNGRRYWRVLESECSFDYNGSSQVVPNYAVPKINTSSLSGICAINNSLVLNNKSYYSCTTSNGSRYIWTVNNGKIGWAASESLLAENTNQKGTNYKWEMQKSELLRAFFIDAGAGKHNYILQGSGEVINVDAEIKNLNYINWIEIGYKEGATFSVYGKEYTIDSNGHINVSADDIFTSTEIIYPSRS